MWAACLDACVSTCANHFKTSFLNVIFKRHNFIVPMKIIASLSIQSGRFLIIYGYNSNTTANCPTVGNTLFNENNMSFWCQNEIRFCSVDTEKIAPIVVTEVVPCGELPSTSKSIIYSSSWLNYSTASTNLLWSFSRIFVHVCHSFFLHQHFAESLHLAFYFFFCTSVKWDKQNLKVRF